MTLATDYTPHAKITRRQQFLRNILVGALVFPYMNKLTLLLFASILTASSLFASEQPRYKPSSSSPYPVDISLNAYGVSPLAPNALGIGEAAPLFTRVVNDGSKFTPTRTTAIIFYRGHW